MIQRLCEPEHMAIIILVLLVALLVVGSGKGLGKLIGPIFKKLFGGGTEVNVNLGGNGMADPTKTVICDPDKCAPMGIVRAQQVRNIKDISGLGEQLHNLTELFFKKLNFIKQQNEVILRAMMKNNQLNESDIPKEP